MLALFMLYAGKSVATIAKQLGVSRQTVYNGIGRFADIRRSSEGLSSVLNDRQPGRPPEQSECVIKALKQLEQVSPAVFGYDDIKWTIPLLLNHLNKNGVEVSISTLNRSLAASDFNLVRCCRRHK
ncbi:MAG TPA: hypothetical protein C5S37_04610 [Methanophagales archaeon]|nr:hypothetical protein [Methanophagales archaeon]